MVLGKVSHNYLFAELGDGEFGLIKFDLHGKGRKESQAHFPFLLVLFGGNPYELLPYTLVQERCFL